MSELLSCCDENLNTIEPVERSIVHQEGIFHKTAHCWFYDDEGYVYFQTRKDKGKLYTTSSGHIASTETPQDCIVREIKEEIGVNINPSNLELIEIKKWMYDTETRHDHVFAYVYLYKVPSNFNEFKPDGVEVSEIIKIKAKPLFEMLNTSNQEMMPIQYKPDNTELSNPYDLLVLPGENLMIKYGTIIDEIIKRI